MNRPKEIFMMTFPLILLLGVLSCLYLESCSAKKEIQLIDSEPYPIEIPKGFPDIKIPEGNELTKARVALGKKLFFDPILSVDSSLSCGSCHLQKNAFTDLRTTSIGVEGRVGPRNTPSLVNVAFNPYFFFEGGSPSLEAQSLGPIETFHEMDFNAALLTKRLAADEHYQKMAQEAYGMEMKLFVIVSALASFERTLISANSPYDRAINGDSSAMTPAQWRGKELFFSDHTNCASCHPAPLFTNFSIENIGLEKEYQDKGRYRVTLKNEDIGKFKTPGLRNIGLTAPYMHDGSLESLDMVIEHFNVGGLGHKNQHPLIRPLDLSDHQKKDLIAFLHALTDQDVLLKPEWAP
ncbi:MAG: cytochrome-c peroxidase [Bacteroidia bacterium]|nr:cytochrome-c peroxidase [Bacteroidia bacterium]